MCVYIYTHVCQCVYNQHWVPSIVCDSCALCKRGPQTAKRPTNSNDSPLFTF